eukprot:NODE_330_length_9451_cov_0.342173.p8 type:complete len:254 gc:universal NODE_330_length_9451_cov_0.342173:7396-6635(-)
MIQTIYSLKNQTSGAINQLTGDIEKSSISLKFISDEDFQSFYAILFKLYYVKEYAKFKYKTELMINLELSEILVSKDWKDHADIEPLFEIQEPELKLIPDMPLQKKQIHHVALGGTFDHLHSGHMLLLYSAAFLSDKVTIGIVKAPKKNHQSLIQSYSERKLIIESILKDIVEEVDVIPLEDPYGPTISDATIGGLIASTETIDNSLKINEIRSRNGLNKLQLIFVDPLPDFKNGDKLSSSKIREEIAKSQIN